MLEKYIHIDTAHTLSLQDQIKIGITQAIASGFIDKQTPVTSSRKLAMSLNVSRNTVLRVYEQLNDDGFFISRERRGYFINPDIEFHSQTTKTKPNNTLDWGRYLTEKQEVFDLEPPISEGYPYRFVHGMVDETTFPVAEWRRCSIQCLNKSNSKLWTSVNKDYDDLIEQIRTRVLPRRGIFAQADEIIVTQGSQQSLNLISQLLTTKNTVVGIENPGYPEAYHQLAANNAHMIPLDVDDNGLVVNSDLDDCNLVYTTPSNQFPTTVRMPTERRKALLDAAEQHDVIIIEDDFENEVNFLEADTLALKGEFNSERIIYLSSFSSTIAPGLRLGFMVASPPLIKSAMQLQRKNHSYPPQNNCKTLALFLSLGHYDSLLKKLVSKLRQKWLTMEKALNYYFPQSGAAPSLSGTAFWIDYKHGFDAHKLAELAEKQGILINSGEQYYFSRPSANCFRLSFNSIEETHIREGIRQLSILAKKILPISSVESTRGQRLKGDDIRSVLTQHTLLTSDCFKIPYTITFQADGRMFGVSDRPNDQDEGYWWVENDTLCFQWKEWQFADIRRHLLIKQGKILMRFDAEGNCVSTGVLL